MPNVIPIQIRNNMNLTQIQNLLTNLLTNQFNQPQDGEGGDEESNNSEDDNNLGVLLNQFNDQERLHIQNLVQMGFDTYEVVQMYVACDKNPDITLSNLMLNR